ncbi:MAG TPA: flagellar hook capping FlgD N-terminal domain-containing protein [Nocardioidaceae bacterium]|nr:flagellar hook capping FlgD N-terminal domain-containing protein [Nocardioidaceae bacterium]
MTTPVNETSGGMLGAATPATSNKDLDKDTFLQLLVAQLRHQDPMNPTDSSQFLAQSAQFTALEKMEAVADQTAQSLAAQLAFGASSMIGRTVSYENGGDQPATGTVDAVRFNSSGPVLDVGGTEIPLDAVTSVRTTPAS